MDKKGILKAAEQDFKTNGRRYWMWHTHSIDLKTEHTYSAAIWQQQKQYDITYNANNKTYELQTRYPQEAIITSKEVKKQDLAAFFDALKGWYEVGSWMDVFAKEALQNVEKKSSGFLNGYSFVVKGTNFDILREKHGKCLLIGHDNGFGECIISDQHTPSLSWVFDLAEQAYEKQH